ncbi:hypothetical protein GCM10027406_08640 [Leifsonia lichenia]
MEVAPDATTECAIAPCPNASALSTAITRPPVIDAKNAVFALIASSWTTSSDVQDISRRVDARRRVAR